MSIEPLTKFWSLIHSTIQEFWSITESHIEDAAVQFDVPIELYYYGELGLDYFSIEEFEKRDPFSNPEKFEKLFARLDVKGWIEPIHDARYQVTDKAREGVRRIIQAGDAQLSGFESGPELDLERLASLLSQIVTENKNTPEPPQKWAIFKRFSVLDHRTPLIVQIREYLMDLFAYRDDSHLSASRPYFNQAGIVWTVLGEIWNGSAVTAAKIAEEMSFRDYEIHDYEIAIRAAVEVGWIEEADVPRTYRPTQTGKAIREKVEESTNKYFYQPWSVLTQAELDELHDLLTKLRGQLREYKKNK